MANPSITKAPNEWELANGDVVVSLYDTDQDGGKLGVRLLLGVTPGNTLLQHPNLVGYCHFNLAKLLQSELSLRLNPEGTQPSLLLDVADGTILDYRIQFGYVDLSTNVFTLVGTNSTLFKAINGRKPYYETDWDISQNNKRLIPTLTNIAGFNSITLRQQAATDIGNRPFRLIQNITDGVPAWAAGNQRVYDIYINENDYYSLSFINGWEGTPLASYNGINKFALTTFEADGTQIGDFETENITANGGGPNVANTDAIDPTGQYRIINFKCGYNNANVAGANNLSHYYVAAQCYSTTPPTGELEVSHIYRFNIIPCQGRDYPIIDVAWINTYGQFDYFSFQKRNVETNTQQRTEYKGVPPSWSEPTVNVNTFDRGQGVFATKVEETYTAATRYIDEYDSEFLKNLYNSPSVFVRFEGDTTWTPVVLTSNLWDEKTPQNQNKRLFQHEISFKTAWNPLIQNG